MSSSARPAPSVIIANLEMQGYRIFKVEVDRGGIDVEAFGNRGRRLELHLDPVPGHVLNKISDH